MSKFCLIAGGFAVAAALVATPAAASVYAQGNVTGFESSCLYVNTCSGTDFGYNTASPSSGYGAFSVSSSPTTGSSPSQVIAQGSASSGAGSSSGNINVTPGMIHAFVTATASSVPVDVGTQVETDASTSWGDQVHVISGTLAANTPVDLLFSLYNEGSLTSDYPNAQYDPNNTYINYSYATANAYLSVGSSSVSCSSSDLSTSIDSFPCSKSMTIHSFVGAYLNISGSLQLSAQANLAKLLGGSTTAAADLSHTSYVTITPETSGASFTSTSGGLYVAPVPLPAAGWLMVSGLVGLGGLARRRGG